MTIYFAGKKSDMEKLQTCMPASYAEALCAHQSAHRDLEHFISNKMYCYLPLSVSVLSTANREL